MRCNTECQGIIETKTIIRSIPTIQMIQYNSFLKSTIAQQYLNCPGNLINSCRPNTMGDIQRKPKRNISQEVLQNRKSVPFVKLIQENQNKSFLDEDYPSIILHPRDLKEQSERKNKNQQTQQQQFNEIRRLSAEKDLKRSMSQGSMIQIYKNYSQVSNSTSSTLYRDSTPTTNISSSQECLQISPLKRSKRVIISYKTGRSLSLTKSQLSFTEASSRAIQEMNKKTNERSQIQRSATPYIERSNINQLLNQPHQQQFTNIILQQNLNSQPSQPSYPSHNNPNKEVISFERQQYYLQNLQSLKINNKNKEYQDMNSQNCYPIQPFQAKFKIIQQKKILVKDCF